MLNRPIHLAMEWRCRMVPSHICGVCQRPNLPEDDGQPPTHCRHCGSCGSRARSANQRWLPGLLDRLGRRHR